MVPHQPFADAEIRAAQLVAHSIYQRLLAREWYEDVSCARSRPSNFPVESYALHLRSLIEFLYWKPKQDDVNAIHFVKSESEWLAARGDIPEVLSEARTRADKQIVHLTKKGFADGAPEKNWKPGVAVAVLVDGLRLFLVHADPSRLHPVVAEAVARLVTLVPAEAKGPSPGLLISPPLETLSLPTKKGTDVSTLPRRERSTVVESGHEARRIHEG